MIFKNNYLKLCSALSLALFASTMSSLANANEADYYNFPTGEHEGGGVRGKVDNCATNAKYPVPLVPQEAKTLTTSPSPELFFYVPDVIQASTLELILLDRDDRVVYQDGFKTGYQPGIISSNLFDSNNSNALKIDSLYHWYLVQECGNDLNPKIVANGSLKRIELDDNLAEKLDNAEGLEKVRLYQEANIWHEAIANLAQLKCDIDRESMISKQLMQIEDFNNDSSLFSQPLNSYCSDTLETESVVMQ